MCKCVPYCSVLSYGSRVWGAEQVLAMLHKANEAPRSCCFEAGIRNRIVKLQISFMKQLVGASVPPLQLLVVVTSSVYHSALRQEIRLALETDLQHDGIPPASLTSGRRWIPYSQGAHGRRLGQLQA